MTLVFESILAELSQASLSSTVAHQMNRCFLGSLLERKALWCSDHNSGGVGVANLPLGFLPLFPTKEKNQE